MGVEGTFEFSPPPGWTDTKAYRYTFAWDQEPIEVPAGEDGRASITWAPTESGYTSLDVWAVKADGTRGDYSNSYSFVVAE